MTTENTKNPLPLLSAFLQETKQPHIKRELISQIKELAQIHNPWERPKQDVFLAAVDYLFHTEAGNEKSDLLLGFLLNPKAPPASTWHTIQVRTRLGDKKAVDLPLPIALAATHPHLLEEYTKQGGLLKAYDEEGRTALAYLYKESLDQWFEKAQQQNTSLFYKDVSAPIKHALLHSDDTPVFHKAALRALRKFPPSQTNKTPQDKWQEVLNLISTLQGKNTVLGQIKTADCEDKLKEDASVIEMIKAFEKGFVALFEAEGGKLSSFPKDQQSGIVSLSKYIMRLASVSTSEIMQEKLEIFRALHAIAASTTGRWYMSAVFQKYLLEQAQQCRERNPSDEILLKATKKFSSNPDLIFGFLHKQTKTLQHLLRLASRDILKTIPLNDLRDLVGEASKQKAPLNEEEKQQLGRLIAESMVARSGEWNAHSSPFFSLLGQAHGIQFPPKHPAVLSDREAILVKECVESFFASCHVLSLKDPAKPSNSENIKNVVQVLQSKAMKAILAQEVIPHASKPASSPQRKM